MDYVPHAEEDVAHMIQELGISSLDQLFETIPQELRIGKLDIPPPMSEMDVRRFMRGLEDQMRRVKPDLSFAGGGAYEHYIPSVVGHIISRSEFYSAYTPYQAEISQGTLQTIFEFQTMICELTKMEVANASMYDGASAAAQSVLMALSIKPRAKRVLLQKSLHPFYRSAVDTYLQGLGVEVVSVPWKQDGSVDLDALGDSTVEDTACVLIQNPNFFGCLEPMHRIKEIVKEADALFAASVNPISLGVIAPPGEYGADIATGEGQPLGVPLSFGGPYLGFFASLEKYIRRMPGRIAGRTEDVNGKQGYVLTFQTREQHIRRERATSNICTNQALCALASGVYISSLGPQGLVEIAELNWQRSHACAQRLSQIEGLKLRFSAPFFNEFVVSCPSPASHILPKLRAKGIEAGIDLGRFFPDMEDAILVCATETKTEDDLDRLAQEWREIL